MTEYERGHHDGMEEMRKRIQDKIVDQRFWDAILEEGEKKENEE